MKLIVIAILALPVETTIAASPKRAVAHLAPTRGAGVSGKVTFTSNQGGLTVNAEIRGLTPGAHGLHVHEFGDCSAPDASSAGAHFNTSNAPHGGPKDERRHVGDLGNIVADKDGNARLESFDTGLSFEGPNAVLGRSIVVHAAPDDFRTQPTGNTGARIACGVIGLVRPE